MKLQQLRYFQAAYIFKNMSKAARELHVSQPPVSVAIQELEREFGTVLFLRSGKSLIPTPEGERLYALAEQLLEHAENVQNIMEEMSRTNDTVRIGLSPMIDVPFYTSVIKRFIDKLPDLKFVFTEVRSEELIELTKRNAIDCAVITHTEDLSKDFYVLPLSVVEAVYCTQSTDFGARMNGDDLKRLVGEPLALFKEGLLTKMVLEHMENSGVDTQTLNVFYTEQLSTLMLLIREGIASGFLLRSLAETIPNVRTVSMTPPVTMHVSLIVNRGMENYSHMRRLIHFVKSVYDNRIHTV